MREVYIPTPKIPEVSDAADLMALWADTPEGRARCNKSTQNALAHGLWNIAATSRSNTSIERKPH